MKQKQQARRILTPPDNVKEIHGFWYKHNRIILLYSSSQTESHWISIYENNHSTYSDIIPWCESHGISFQILDRKCSKVYADFTKSITN